MSRAHLKAFENCARGHANAAATLALCLMAAFSIASPAKAVAGGVVDRSTAAPAPLPPSSTLPATPDKAKSPVSAASRAEQLESRRGRTGNLVGHGGPIKALAVDPESRRAATGSFDYAMMIWDVSGRDAKVLHRLDDHEGAVNAVAFVPGSSRVLAAGDDGAVTLWDAESGKLLHRFKGHTAKINQLAVSTDGRWAVSSSWDRTARVWDLLTMTAAAVLEGHNGPVNAAQFSNDGNFVYTASYDGDLRLFKREDGSLVRSIYKNGWGINVLARVPETDQLVFGALNGTVKVIDGASGDVIKDLEGYDRPVLSIAVVARPGLLATGAGDGTIRVVRLADWSPIETYNNPFGPVWALAFTPDATALYYGGLDDFATYWQISPREKYEAVESAFPRRFQITGNPDDPVAQGELQFARKCSVCHTLKPDGRNRAGPTLYKIFGRRIASLPDYPYSKDLKGLDIVWTEETVSKLFELGPEKFTPGSKMPLQKMTNPAQRDALIAYLKIASETGAGQAPEGPPDSTSTGAKQQSSTETRQKGSKP